MPRRRKKSRTLGSMTDSQLFNRLYYEREDIENALTAVEKAVSSQSCSDAYWLVSRSLQDHGFRQGLLAAIDGAPEERDAVERSIEESDRQWKAYERLLEAEKRFEKKCLRTPDQVPLESRFARKKPESNIVRVGRKK